MQHSPTFQKKTELDRKIDSIINGVTKQILFEPLDSRAAATFKYLLEKFFSRLIYATSFDEVVDILKRSLPPMVPDYVIQILSTIDYDLDKPEDDLVTYLIEPILILAQYFTKELMFRDLPFFGNLIIYCREDILDYYGSHEEFGVFFPKIQEESMAIIVNNDIHLPQDVDIYHIALSKEQYIAFAFCNYSYQPRITVQKDLDVAYRLDGGDISLDGRFDVQDYGSIVEDTAITYIANLTDDEKLKMPYTVLINIGGQFGPINFESMEFMEGITLYCRLLNVPNKGNNIIWRNITLRQGNVDLPINF